MAYFCLGTTENPRRPKGHRGFSGPSSAWDETSRRSHGLQASTPHALRLAYRGVPPPGVMTSLGLGAGGTSARGGTSSLGAVAAAGAAARGLRLPSAVTALPNDATAVLTPPRSTRSEEHTSELQSPCNL